MAIEMWEADRSGAFVIDAATGAKRAEILYNLKGSDDDSDIYAHIIANSPSTHPEFSIPRKGVDCTPEEGNTLRRVKVTYETPRTGAAATAVPGTEEVEYDTTGGTTRIMTSLETVDSKAPVAATIPDQYHMINVSSDGRSEGVDIVSPRLSMRVQKVFASVDVDTAYIASLALATGTTNDATWRGFEVGEVLFTGARARKNNADDSWLIEFTFQISPNKEGIEIDYIEPIDKKGWDYLWVYSEPATEPVSKRTTSKPRAAYVERVYEASDFSALGISTT